MKIFKYQVPIKDYCEIQMPKNTQILTFQSQYDIPCIWALVDPEQPIESRKFRIAGTGHEIKGKALEYIGTCQMMNGTLVWHLFEIKQ